MPPRPDQLAHCEHCGQSVTKRVARQQVYGLCPSCKFGYLIDQKGKVIVAR